jgi:hypothetical protein
MKDRRGPIGRATELAGSVVAGVKRRQQARSPKVMLFDAGGRPRTLDPGSPAAEGLIGVGQRMTALALPPADAGDDPLDPPADTE